MPLSAIQIDGRTYFLDAAAAARVRALLAQADGKGPSLVPDGGRVSATFHMMDELRMKTLVVDNKDISVSDDVARIIEGLQGQNAALASVVRGDGQQMRDAAGNAAEAMRQDAIRCRDVKTAYGSYVQRMGDAWKTPADA